MPLTIRRRELRVTLSGFALLAMTWGCSDRTQLVKIDGPTALPDVPLAVDVTNFNGPVTVRVDDTVTEPVVTFFVGAGNLAEKTEQKELNALGSAFAVGTMSEGRYTLRVNALVERNEVEEPYVDVLIRVPRCDGVAVRSAGGPVEIVGVSGSVQVQSGAGGRPGGRIEVRTGAPMHQDVSLVSTSGPVFYLVGPDSSGRFDLSAEHGRTEFLANHGSITGAQNYTDRCVATLNGGENAITLRSGRGIVRAEVMDDPVAYIPYRKDIQEEYLGTWSLSKEKPPTQPGTVPGW